MSAPDMKTRVVKLKGYTPIMFDRYAGDNKTQLPVGAKMYFLPGTKDLCIPRVNVSSFLSAQNTTSVAKLVGGRSYKKLANALLGFVMLDPEFIPLTRNGDPITFHGFEDGMDKEGGIYVHESVARLKGGIPNPKKRPVIQLPWEVEFKLTIIRNDEFDETLLKTAFNRGGIAIGLGTYRGVFGKFLVDSWE